MQTRRRGSFRSIAHSTAALGALFCLSSVPNAAFAQQLPITVLSSFGGSGGSNPSGSVSLDSSGNIYGTTANGGVWEHVPGSRTLDLLAPVQGNADGGVVMDGSGNLYGVSPTGGSSPPGGPPIGTGFAFEVASGASTAVNIGNFPYPSGLAQPSPLTLDSSGNLYGTTYRGGANNDGTVFEITKGSGTVTTLATFNGLGSVAGVTFDGSGNLYGTVGSGGANGDGMIFEIAHGSSTLTTLFSFDAAQGYGPNSAVTIDAGGDLFGRTGSGGSRGDGTIYELASGGKTAQDIVSLATPNTGFQNGNLILDAGGDLFGTLASSGFGNGGQVYKIFAGSHTLTTIAEFTQYDGVNPAGGLTLDGSGNLYGVTSGGGSNNAGTLYEIVGGAAAVPETSSALTFGLLLSFGTLLGLARHRQHTHRKESVN